MSVTRRDFLYTSTVIGATVLLSPIVNGSQMTTQTFGLTSPPRTVKILRSGAAHVEFEAGVRESLDTRSPGHMQSIAGFMETAFEDFDQLKRYLGGAKGTAIVGLMKDSESIFFNEAIRDIGGSIVCKGSHIETATFSQHEFVTTRASAGIGSVFGHRLAHGQHSACIQEVTLHTPVAPFFEPEVENNPGDWSWYRVLGYHLGQVASGSWSMASVHSRILIGTEVSAPGSGTSFVSLVALN